LAAADAEKTDLRPWLYALLACAARREARESRASLSGLHSRRQAAVLQEGRRPRR